MSLMLVAMGLAISVTGRALPRTLSLSRDAWRSGPSERLAPAVRIAGVATALLGIGGVILAAADYSKLAFGFGGVAIALGLLAFAVLVPYFLLPGPTRRSQTRRRQAPMLIVNMVAGIVVAEFIVIWVLRARH
jgi:protein-S-isoprenylcysteine O-methyltransferase Ste14